MSVFSPYVMLAIAVAVLGAYGTGRFQQYHRDAIGFQKKLDEIELETQKRMLRAQEVSTVVVTEYVKGADKIKTVFKDRERIITKEIPREVIVRSDSDCVVPNFFGSLWNSANQGSVPDPSQGVDGGRSAVKLSDISAQHERETQLCLIKERKLESLKEWVRQQCLALNLKECKEGG